MAIGELSVFTDASVAPLTVAPAVPLQLHRIQEVRCRQGMSLRSAARQIRSDVRALRAQEQPGSDLRLSDLYRWQAALDVPVEELLVDSSAPLSRPVAERAKMVRIMKTALTLRENATGDSQRRMAENLVDQLVELMPELKEVSPWHSVGVRRSLDDMGRVAQQTIDDTSYFGGDMGD